MLAEAGIESGAEMKTQADAETCEILPAMLLPADIRSPLAQKSEKVVEGCSTGAGSGLSEVAVAVAVESSSLIDTEHPALESRVEFASVGTESN